MPNSADTRLDRIHSLVEMQKVIPRQYLASEADLMLTKWPTYRFMSPGQATALFIEEYAVAYKNSNRRNFDRDEAARAKPTSKLDTTNHNSQYTQMWQARQIADQLGVPYSFYLNENGGEKVYHGSGGMSPLRAA